MDTNNRGSVWKNPKKSEGDKKPHFTGKAEIGGQQYRLSVWKADAQSLQENPRRPILNIQFKTEEEFQQLISKQHNEGMQQANNSFNQPVQSTGSQAPQGKVEPIDFDDDIPF